MSKQTIEHNRRPVTRRLLARLGHLGAVALVLWSAAGPGLGRALAATRTDAARHAPAPAMMAEAAAVGQTVAASPADEVTPKRQAVAAFVGDAFTMPPVGPSDVLGSAVTADEAALAVAKSPEADVVRLYDGLPIIRHWPEIQAHMAAHPANASPPSIRPQSATPRTFSPSQTAELDQLRSDLDALLALQETWGPLVGNTDPAYVTRLEDGRRMVREATFEDLAGLRDALAWIPDWQQTLGPDLNGVVGPGQSLALAHQAGAPDAAPDAAPAVKPVTTDEQCTDADYNRDPLPLIIASAALRGSALLEGYIAGFFTKDIKLCVAVIFVVLCADFPNPVYYILKIVQYASNRAADGLDASIQVAGTCTSIRHWKYTVQHRNDFLEAAQAVMASEIELNNELVESAENVDYSNRETWKLQLQLAIEENLLEPQPQPDGSDENRISLFQLTDTVCFNPDELLPTPAPPLPTPELIDPASDSAPPPVLDPLPTVQAPTILTDRREQCGIELVQRLVSEAIQLNQLAGNDIHDAQSNFAAANDHLAAGRYKEAYLRYRQAYRAAVQPDAEPRGFASDTLNR